MPPKKPNNPGQGNGGEGGGNGGGGRNKTGGNRRAGRGRGGGGNKPPPNQNNRPADQNKNAVSRQRMVSECGDDACPVCLSRMVIFAVGLCNHHVCSECSTRMRVICDKKECPICRQDMPKVIHTETRQTFETLENQPFRMDRKYRICFENDRLEDAYAKLLLNSCPVCEEASFKTFKQLDTHVRREHERFYCELCTGHLKVFTHERKVYSRAGLAEHKKNGDPDDSSMKKHPLCEFCMVRYVDDEDLFTHLRRDHFFCHFCESEKQQFFDEYSNLRDHFIESHFLCQEGDCYNERFTSAFRSEIDLKAHRLERHSQSLTKSAAKQNRMVDLDFSYSRPARDQASRRRGRDASPPRYHDQTEQQQSSYDRGGGVAAAADARPPDLSAESFPSLGAGAVGGGGGGGSDSLARRLAGSTGHNTREWSDGHRRPREEDFPSLPGASAYVPPPSSMNGMRQKPQKGKKVAPAPEIEDFPSLGGSAPQGMMSNFRPGVSSAPIYRRNPAQPSTWTDAASVRQPEPMPEPSASRKPGGMTTLTKQTRQVRNVPNEADFPGLGPPSAPVVSKEPEDKGAKKKSKKKNNNSSIRDVVTGDSSSLKGEANLKSAADLISLEKKPKKKQPAPAPVLDEDSDEGEWSQAKPSKSFQKEPSVQKKPQTNGAPSIPGLNLQSLSLADAMKPHRPSKEAPSAPSRPATAPVAPKPKPKAEDFPSLGASSKKMSANFRPASAQVNGGSGPTWGGGAVSNGNAVKMSNNNPPPGFGSRAPSKPSSKAPPGFASKNNVKRGRYFRPENFDSRNQALMSKIASIFGGGRSLEFSQFKGWSGDFKNERLSCKEYYDKCLGLTERGAFMEFFPELLVLLPDIKKQQELFSVHNMKSSLEIDVTACPRCDQIVGFGDIAHHKSSHELDSDFPALF